MMKQFCRFVAVASFFVALQVFAEPEPDLGVELYLRSSNRSEPVPIKANFDDWQTEDYRSGKKLYAKQIARSGLTYGDFSLGYTRQLYYYLNFSPDTALLHYLDKNNQLDDFKGRLALGLTANNAEGEGFYIGYNRKYGDFNFSATLSLLSLRNLMLGEATGVFEPGETLQNSTNIHIDYAYHEDKILDRQVQPPKGRGGTLDVAAGWQRGDHRVFMEIEELYSLLQWDRAPASVINGSVDALSSGDQAVLRYRHIYSRIRQHLPSQSRAGYSYAWQGRYLLGLEWEQVDHQSWQKLMIGVRGSGWGQARLTLAPDDKILGVVLDTPLIKFSLESDSLNARESRVLNFSMFASWRF